MSSFSKTFEVSWGILTVKAVQNSSKILHEFERLATKEKKKNVKIKQACNAGCAKALSDAIEKINFLSKIAVTF